MRGPRHFGTIRLFSGKSVRSGIAVGRRWPFGVDAHRRRESLGLFGVQTGADRVAPAADTSGSLCRYGPAQLLGSRPRATRSAAESSRALLFRPYVSPPQKCSELCNLGVTANPAEQTARMPITRRAAAPSRE